MISRIAPIVATFLLVPVVFSPRNTRKDAKISVDAFLVDFFSCTSCVSWAKQM
jgi:uncharacterized protein with PQ loop repeat